MIHGIKRFFGRLCAGLIVATLFALFWWAILLQERSIPKNQVVYVYQNKEAEQKNE